LVDFHVDLFFVVLSIYENQDDLVFKWLKNRKALSEFRQRFSLNKNKTKMPWDYCVRMSSVKREQKGQSHKPTQPATPIQ